MTVSSTTPPSRPCDDIPRFRTDFVTYCSATTYFHVPLAQLVESPRPLEVLHNHRTAVRLEGGRCVLALEGVGDNPMVRRVSTLPGRRGARDTLTPAYCPGGTLPHPSANEEKVLFNY